MPITLPSENSIPSSVYRHPIWQIFTDTNAKIILKMYPLKENMKNIKAEFPALQNSVLHPYYSKGKHKHKLNIA